MSREVMGALDDASAPAEGRTGSLTDSPDLAPATLRLDDDPVDHGRVTVGRAPGAPDVASDLGPAANQDVGGGGPSVAPLVARTEMPGGPGGTGRSDAATGQRGAAGLWLGVRHLVQGRRSRAPALTLVVVAALVGGLLGAAVAQRAALLAREQNVSVSAWIAFTSYPGLDLYVVNSGPVPLTVTGADLGGGIENGRAPVELSLQRSFEVEPGKAGHAPVTATSACDAGPLSRGGARDGDLRVTVATQDLRERVISVPSLAGMSVSSVEIYESVCSQDVYMPPVTAEFGSRADGRLTMTLRSDDGENHEITLSVPDGIILETEPAMPLQLTGFQGQSVAIRMRVDSCTQNNTQLLAGEQVRLQVDGEQSEWYADTTPLLAWYAREVAEVCGGM